MYFMYCYNRVGRSLGMPNPAHFLRAVRYKNGGMQNTSCQYKIYGQRNNIIRSYEMSL